MAQPTSQGFALISLRDMGVEGVRSQNGGRTSWFGYGHKAGGVHGGMLLCRARNVARSIACTCASATTWTHRCEPSVSKSALELAQREQNSRSGRITGTNTHPRTSNKW